jgi:glycosyltransferase involved in cell wall biosynthesis
MKIGIDCRTILNPQKGEAAGVGHYTYQLVRHLIEIDKKNEYILFFDRQVKEKKMAKFLRPNVRVKFFPFIQYKSFLPFTYAHLLVSAFLVREKLDLYHSPVLHFPLSYLGTLIVTAHDLAIYKYPNLFPKGQYLSLKVIVPQALKRAKIVIAVSKSTKRDIETLFKIPRRKIKVIYNGLDERFFKKTNEEDINRVKRKFKITEDYILFLGTLEPRKNIERLIEAFEMLPSSLNLKLVIAGKKGWKSGTILKKILQSPKKKNIILTGYVEAENLDALLSGAKVFVFPSLYEGFGMPVTEAMAKGVPVVTSKKAGSLEEITARGALLVDPYKPEEISEAIKKVLTDSKLAQELARKGSSQAQKFSWHRCARETLEIYKKAVT